MNRVTRTVRSISTTWITLLFVLALTLAAPKALRAQGQWASNGNNIYNTNTGTVGVGTSGSGNYRLHIYGVGGTWESMMAVFSGSHNIVHEPQTGIKVGIFNNYHNLSGVGETERQFVSLGYSNGYSANMTGFYSRQKVWHNGSIAHGVWGIAESDAAGAAGQILFGGRFEAKTTDVSGGAANTAFGVFAKGTVGASTNLNHSAYGIMAQASAAAGTDASVNTYAVYADATNSGAGRAYGVYSAAGTNYFNGFLGVGTASPGYKVDVQGGQLNVSGGLCIAGDCRTSWSQVGGGGGESSGWTNSGGMVNLTNSSAQVGIGTTSPGNKVEVVQANPPTASSIRVLSGASSAYNGYAIGRTATEGYWGIVGAAGHYATGSVAGDVVFRAENNLIFANGAAANVYLKSNGNVGVGTTAPAYKLHVNGSLNASSINVNGSPVTSSQWTTNGGNIHYAAGNVGIGISSPTNKLHVGGSITVDGNINAKYQDLAEWVPASQVLPAGTVVTLDPSKSNHILASSKSYDTRVAGVVSAQPGIVLGERGDNKVLIATTGRVKVMVDASSGPIAVGDLLVTSDVPGVAMKSQPVNLNGIELHRPGTLLGKALEPLAKGQGEILVLLSLQ